MARGEGWRGAGRSRVQTGGQAHLCADLGVLSSSKKYQALVKEFFVFRHWQVLEYHGRHNLLLHLPIALLDQLVHLFCNAGIGEERVDVLDLLLLGRRVPRLFANCTMGRARGEGARAAV